MSRQIAFPFHVGHDGGIAYIEDPIQQALQRIIVTLLTSPGERVMSPEFGTPVREALFENIDEVSVADVVIRVQQALARWEPNVIIHDVIPSQEGLVQGGLVLTINFSAPPRQEVISTVVDVGGAITGGPVG